MAATEYTTRSSAVEALELNRDGFDEAAVTARLSAALTARGISLERNEDIYLAKLFTERAMERLGADVQIENVCAHPLWVHVTVAHDGTRLETVPDCEACALLSTLWRFYLRRHDERGRQRAARARAVVAVFPTLRALRREVGEDSSHVLEAVDALLWELDGYQRHTASRWLPAPARIGRRGRPPQTMLRMIEQTLKAAGLGDKEVTQLIFGNDSESALRSTQDRRRPLKAKLRRSEK